MNKFLKIYMYPVWIVALFTTAKSFKANPILGAPLLNMLGLHVARVVIAHGITSFRWFLLKPFMSKGLRKKYHEDGFVAIEGFLSPQQLAAVLRDIHTLPTDTNPARQMIQGNTVTQRILLDDACLDTAPGIANVVNSNRFLHPIFYTAARWSRPLVYLQRIRNGAKDGKADPQKTMHSDTFHPTVKAWLFLEDVTPEKGPFTYVRGSHKLTWKRLKWEYKRSVKGYHLQDGYSEKGSLRADDEDLIEMELEAPKGLCAKAGTLVIANTNGFHGRGRAEDGQSRLELWAYSRSNPFSPFVGIGSKTFQKIANSFLQSYWSYKDRKAEKRNSKASWHPVKLREILDNI